MFKNKKEQIHYISFQTSFSFLPTWYLFQQYSKSINQLFYKNLGLLGKDALGAPLCFEQL